MFKNFIFCFCSLVVFGGLVVTVVESTALYSNSIASQFNQQPNFNSLSTPYSNNLLKRRCPICDSSVFSYCSDKLFHDSCCCHDPNNPYDRLPFQCQFADCSFLHANSCHEHQLITACCCTKFMFYRK
ncbi:uncharacterized protein LOC132706084 [Cylas formicarius]|uniref:uncharacterized protein LOC132706084 n=1 Tax=Cylas formicarius TaxID=197179 RepID=UPI002958CC36|nr:uncharacterized protein LOC132706084 [Cylas formicarius]